MKSARAGGWAATDKQGKDPGGSDVGGPWLAARWGAVCIKLFGGWKLGRYFGCGRRQVKLRWRDGVVGLWERL